MSDSLSRKSLFAAMIFHFLRHYQGIIGASSLMFIFYVVLYFEGKSRIMRGNSTIESAMTNIDGVQLVEFPSLPFDSPQLPNDSEIETTDKPHNTNALDQEKKISSTGLLREDEGTI